VGISVDGIEGPGNYGLNRKVTLTVLVVDKGKVVANFAIVQPNETDAPKVAAAVAKVLGKKPPTAEELGGAAPKRDAPDPLKGLMRQMIQMNNDAATCARVGEAMLAWAGDDRAKRKELADYCAMVLKLGYGTDHAKAELKKLAGN
jgi:hypothetical protein